MSHTILHIPGHTVTQSLYPPQTLCTESLAEPHTVCITHRCCPHTAVSQRHTFTHTRSLSCSHLSALHSYTLSPALLQFCAILPVFHMTCVTRSSHSSSVWLTHTDLYSHGLSVTPSPPEPLTLTSHTISG